MKKLFIAFLAIAPTFTFAVSNGISQIIEIIAGLANQLYALVFILIVLGFAWGVLKFVFKDGDAQAEGKNMMIWSIIALFVLVSVWGIIAILQKTLGLEGETTIKAPNIPVAVKKIKTI